MYEEYSIKKLYVKDKNSGVIRKLLVKSTDDDNTIFDCAVELIGHNNIEVGELPKI